MKPPFIGSTNFIHFGNYCLVLLSKVAFGIQLVVDFDCCFIKAFMIEYFSLNPPKQTEVSILCIIEYNRILALN